MGTDLHLDADLPGAPAAPRDDFLDLVACAREIVLAGPGEVPRLPRQPSGVWYDVTPACVRRTDGMPSYGG